jgi:type III secretion system low calcium response chaperone LcrH/SycD
MAKADPKTIHKATDEMASRVGKETAEAQDTVLKQLLEHGIKPKDVMGLNDALVEGIYGQAFRLYNTGKYKDAIQLFRLLIMLNSSEPKYTMGLAACFHMLKEYENATGAYTLCGTLDPGNPIPYYHVSDCYIKMEDKRSALIALECALKRVGDKPEYATIKDRIIRSIDSLKKEIKQEKEAKKSL